MPDDETTFYLTPNGWQREGKQPDDCLEIVTYVSPDKMWSRAYFSEDWRTDDKDALRAAHSAHGYKPKPFG
jgi:hypothetical protein